MRTDSDINTLNAELQTFYADNIPAAASMGAGLCAYDDEKLVLSAPLSKNHNDHNNAFGGSLYNLCVLAGWTALYLRCKDIINRPHIVTRDAQMRYRHPVNQEIIEATCKLPNARQWDGFFAHYEKTGQTTLSLSTTVYGGHADFCARLDAVYVLLGE